MARYFFAALVVVGLVGCGGTGAHGGSGTSGATAGGGATGGSSGSTGTSGAGDVLTPVGNAASATIGPAGGHLAAPNGQVELDLPAGAVSAETQISVQLVDLARPDGSHQTIYRLSPDGLAFPAGKEAVMTYHYTDKDLAETMPNHLVARVRASDGHYEQLANASVDETHSTVSGRLPHFSDWLWTGTCRINGKKKMLLEGGQMTLGMACQAQPPEKNAPAITFLVKEYDTLPPSALPTDSVSVENIPDGNVEFGTTTIDANSPTVTYHAPVYAPIPHTVFLSWDVKVYSKLPGDDGRLFHDVTTIVFQVIPAHWEIQIDRMNSRKCGADNLDASYFYFCTLTVKVVFDPAQDDALQVEDDGISSESVAFSDLVSCEPNDHDVATIPNQVQPGVRQLRMSGKLNETLGRFDVSWSLEFQDLPIYEIQPKVGSPHQTPDLENWTIPVPYHLQPVDQKEYDFTFTDPDGAQRGEKVTLSEG